MRISTVTELFGGEAAFAQFMDDRRKLGVLEDRWRREKKTKARWSIIREAYEIQTPRILSGRPMCPYILDWDFTPIEYDAWQDIRRWSLPFFPQYPVGPYFVDVADPIKKIGLELDGKQYHDEQKDRKRDAWMWRNGWRIFRVPGYQCRKAPWQPFVDDWRDQLREDPYGTRNKLYEWALNYGEGLVFSLSVYYYGNRYHGRFYSEFRDIAKASLDAHRYEPFPLGAPVIYSDDFDDLEEI